ncbi:hypothetical protein OBBRIDRAFT_241737 [Obba rivulosa]|uniref:Uncharacterized protein n=1 Tax=Obba rivulosa TaxID=1052685 RepID=A0A8E2AKT0_9APHY|nr:hypothetical protein OBBRIDRAFT_241737 [Obba rivulosa]
MDGCCCSECHSYSRDRAGMEAKVEHSDSNVFSESTGSPRIILQLSIHDDWVQRRCSFSYCGNRRHQDTQVHHCANLVRHLCRSVNNDKRSICFTSYSGHYWGHRETIDYPGTQLYIYDRPHCTLCFQLNAELYLMAYSHSTVSRPPKLW